MAIITFNNFTGQIPGANYSSLDHLVRGRSGQFGDSIIDPNRFPGVLSPFPLGLALINNSVLRDCSFLRHRN